VGTLIDTTVFIAIERGDLTLDAVMAREGVMAISAVTASELLHGVERAPPLRRDKRERFVQWGGHLSPDAAHLARDRAHPREAHGTARLAGHADWRR
jgi:predicted nucleic acid-binding protein